MVAYTKEELQVMIKAKELEEKNKELTPPTYEELQKQNQELKQNLQNPNIPKPTIIKENQPVITKKLAAIEVLKVRTLLKTVGIISITSGFLILIANQFGLTPAGILLLIESGIIGYFLLKNTQETKRITTKYDIQPPKNSNPFKQ